MLQAIYANKNILYANGVCCLAAETENIRQISVGQDVRNQFLSRFLYQTVGSF